MGRSAGPKGPPPRAVSSSEAASGSLTPMLSPNRPANMFPFTKAPSWPNIGFTSTVGPSGTRERKRSLSSSVAVGIFTVACSSTSGPGDGLRLVYLDRAAARHREVRVALRERESGVHALGLDEA